MYIFYFLTQVTSVKITTTNGALASHAIVKSSKADVPSVNPSSKQSLCYTLPPTLHHSFSRNLPCHSCILNHIGSNSLMEQPDSLKVFLVANCVSSELTAARIKCFQSARMLVQARDYELRKQEIMICNLQSLGASYKSITLSTAFNF